MTVKKKIMVVEDSAIMGLFLGNMISKDPNLIVAEFASNGKEALDKLNTANPDLIILDLEMPEIDGITFLRLAKSKSKAKIIVVTALEPNSPKINQAKMLGAMEVIYKPAGVASSDVKAQKEQEIKAIIYKVLGI